jgi:hypothetical protein
MQNRRKVLAEIQVLIRWSHGLYGRKGGGKDVRGAQAFFGHDKYTVMSCKKGLA